LCSPLDLSSLEGHDDFAKKLEAINNENQADDVDTGDMEDLITDKTDDVRVIVSLDGTKGDVDVGNR
jgi:hypothetical protein